MIKQIIIFSIAVLTISACTTVYEKQFIDVDDTLKIEGGMSKSSIQNILGKPNEVVRGIVMEEGDVFEMWRYAVQEGMGDVAPQNLPRKPGKDIKFTNWENTKDMFVLFKNNKLVRWGDMKFDWCNGYCQAFPGEGDEK